MGRTMAGLAAIGNTRVYGVASTSPISDARIAFGTIGLFATWLVMGTVRVGITTTHSLPITMVYSLEAEAMWIVLTIGKFLPTTSIPRVATLVMVRQGLLWEPQSE